MTETVAPTDVASHSVPQRKIYPVSVYILFPAGTGLCRGSVALRNGNKITMDTYTVRKGKGGDEPGPVLMEAVNALLRTAPGRPVRYMLATENRQEYRATRTSLDTLITRAALADVQYGSSFMEPEILRFAAQHALTHPHWKDLQNSVHSYVTTIGNGDHCYTSVVSSSPRHLRWAEFESHSYDPVAANLTAIRDSLVGVGERSAAGIWSSSESVNAMFRGQKSTLSAEANTCARELNTYRKNKNMALTYNSEASWHLMELGLFLAQRQQRRHLAKQHAAGAEA